MAVVGKYASGTELCEVLCQSLNVSGDVQRRLSDIAHQECNCHLKCRSAELVQLPGLCDCLEDNAGRF